MSFGDDIAAWRRKAEARMELAIRKIALDSFSEVVLMSPVDTGRFRGNWQVRIGSVPMGTVVMNDPTGTLVISQITATALKLENNQTIYLINNLPYARRLEYGWSKQAPGGMVRLTVQRWKTIVEKVAQEIAKG